MAREIPDQRVTGDVAGNNAGVDPPAGATSRDTPAGATSRDPPPGATSRDPPAGATSRDPPAGATSRDSPAGATSRDQGQVVTDHSLLMADPVDEVSDGRSAQETGGVLLGFLRSDLQLAGIEVPQCLRELQQAQTSRNLSLEANSRNHSGPLVSINDYDGFLDRGRTLREIANEIERSPERDRIRQEAENIQFQDLTMEHFSCLMSEMFRDGQVTLHRIVVLFLFCSDVAKRALRSQLHSLFEKIINWALNFVMVKVTAVVQANGGWGAIIQETATFMYKLAIFAACAVIVGAGLIYIKNSTK